MSVKRRVSGAIRSLQPCAALAAEAGTGRAPAAALLTQYETQVGATVVAELPLSGRFAALRADSLFALDYPGEHLSAGRLGLNVGDHLLGPRRGHLYADPGGVFHAEAFLLVPAVRAYPLVALGTAVEVPLGFILAQFEGRLPLLVPRRGHSRISITYDVGAPLDLPRDPLLPGQGRPAISLLTISAPPPFCHLL